MTEYGYSPETGLRMQTGFGFKTIWVIESLPDGDYRTGKELYDDVLCYKQIQHPGFLIEFIDVADRLQLFAALGRITNDLRQTGNVPLLHIETHGSKEGLTLKSSEFVRYEELLPAFRTINVLAQNNLFVVVAACEGGYLAFVLRESLTSPCPFWGICGPSVEISAGDVLKAYSAFYEQLLVSSDAKQALAELQQAIPAHGAKFNIWNAEYLFLLAFRHYVENLCKGSTLQTRVNGIVAIAFALVGDRLDVEGYRRYIEDLLGTPDGQRQQFEFLKTKFFLHDIYPGHEELPNPKFEHAMKLLLRDKEVHQ